MRQNMEGTPDAPSGGSPRLKWLFVAGLLPCLIALTALSYVYVENERRHAESELLRTARALTEAVDREIAATQIALQALAASPALAAGDFAGLHAQAAAFLKTYPADNIVLSDPSGQQLMNARRAFGEALPMSGSPELVERVVRTGQPAVSDLFSGTLSGRMLVASGVPVHVDGKVAYVLMMGFAPQRLGDLLGEQASPAGWVAELSDSGHTIVARTVEPDRFVGSRLAPDAIRVQSEAPQGSVQAITDRDVRVVGAFSRSRLSGWTVAVGLPTAEFRARLWRSVGPLVLAMILLLSIALVLAWSFSSYVKRALRQLGGAVQGAMSGALTGPLPTAGPREIVQLADDFGRMLAARREAESALKRSEGLYRSLFGNMLNGFAYCRMVFDGETPCDFVYVSVNPAFEARTGRTNVVGRKASEVIPGLRESDPALLEAYGRVVRTGVPESFEIHVKALAQWYAISVYRPEPDHFVTVFDVITDRKMQERRIARLVRIYAVLSGINSTIVRIHDRQTLFEEACRVAVENGDFGMAWIGLLTDDGEKLRPVAGCGIDVRAVEDVSVSPQREVPVGQGTAHEALASRRPAHCNDITAVSHQGPIRAQALAHGYRSVCALPLVVDGRGIGVMGLYAREADFFDEEELKLLDELGADISFALQYIEREERLNYLAYYDALTGLPNRTLFQDRLAQFIGSNRNGDHGIAVILIDLDHFTHFNDIHGRRSGDALLVQVAARLGETVRGPCSLARINADTFAVAVSGLKNGAQAATAVEKRVFEALARPFVVEGEAHGIAAHAGIALHPGDGDDAETLFQSAEAALKEAQSSRLRCRYYAPEINTRIAADLKLERELRIALDAGQFAVHYQPRVDLVSGEIVGAEALIRWRHPERGLVAPTDFIPLAERTGLIVPIGDWVVDAVCAQQAAWKAEGLPIVPVAVNLSPIQFAHDDLLPGLTATLARHGVDAKDIELELTESLMVHNPDEAARTMQALRSCGLRLSLDDFGTGYSSLAYLHRFPFDFVKIDRSFVSEITHSPGNAAIATAVISMAHRLGLRVVAEGVETEGQLRYLRRHGCDQIQGYYFSPPVPGGDFAATLREGRRLNPGRNETDGETRTILIVDDETGIQSALHRLLRRDGYRVLKASGGEEGLALLAEHDVQVIISDQRMPGMSGAEFLSAVKELHPHTIRIILSGYTDLAVVTDAVNRGAVFKFLTKPWDDELLRANIRDAFMRYEEASSLRRERALAAAQAEQ